MLNIENSLCIDKSDLTSKKAHQTDSEVLTYYDIEYLIVIFGALLLQCKDNSYSFA